MSEELPELFKFHKTTSVNPSGELMINAGRYSRGAVIAAFEMMGGIEAFALWAVENQSEFYTKMFGKVIGRELEVKSSDGLEDMLTILDGEADEIEEAEIAKEMPPMKTMSETQYRMAMAAEKYARNEPTD